VSSKHILGIGQTQAANKPRYWIVLFAGNRELSSTPCRDKNEAVQLVNRKSIELDPTWTDVVVRQYYTDRYGRWTYRVLHRLCLRRTLEVSSEQ
jgi:hypothetical protein